MANITILSLLCFFFVIATGNDNNAHRVVDLPGQPPVTFDHYAGDIMITPNKSIFYWFFESEKQNAPLVLWLNFGPGCSSVAYGGLLEVGPFLVRNNNGQLILNDYSWNKVANLLFMDAPLGVGFSNSSNSADLKHYSDETTAYETYIFLKCWFKKFPQYKAQNLFLAGQSYVGHFGPQLAELILSKNSEAKRDSVMNIKGILMGNPSLEDPIDFFQTIEFAWTHGVINDELWLQIKTDCSDYLKKHEISSSCEKSLVQGVHLFNTINEFNINRPLCNTSMIYAKDSMGGSSYDLMSSYDPCVDIYLAQYLDSDDVQRALHVERHVHPYLPCTILSNFRWNVPARTVLPLVKKLIKSGLRIWIYSGDADGKIPFTGTKQCLKKMHLQIVDGWRPWRVNGQVVGFTQTYENGATFVTVRGAGHHVPLDAPRQAYSILNHFLIGETLPS